jgi:Ca2+-binding EF-hand superfamily protein
MFRFSCRWILSLSIIWISSTPSSAQSMLAIHPTSGLVATSASYSIEWDGPRYSAPRHEVASMRTSSGIQLYPTPFRFTEESFGIPDQQDVVFFSEKRIIRVRLHLKLIGKSLRDQWKERLKNFFDFLDRDSDGRLNAFEAEYVFSNRSMNQMIGNGFAYPSAADQDRSLKNFDKDGDGEISFDEFAAYYAPSASTLISSRLAVNQDTLAPILTNELFTLIDQDKDGQLSKDEISRLPEWVKRFDIDEDECLSTTEIVPRLFNMPRTNPKTQNLSETIQVYRIGAIPDTILEQILNRYDKNKNLRLSKAESGFDDITFNRLDRNQNEELTVTELIHWKEIPPDIELELTLGKNAKETKVKLLNGPDGKPSPIADWMEFTENGGARLVAGNQQVQFSIFAAANPRAPQYRVDFQNLFREADPENKGYILDVNLVGPQFQLLRVLFDTVDRNSDGKMTRKEFNRYFEMQNNFVGMPLTVSFGAQTPSLFSLLDENRDGRLSYRELKQAWTVLSKAEVSNKEFITRSAIQPQGTVQYGRTTQVLNAPIQTVYNPSIQASNKGPIWFYKMDRNGDEEISRIEFLGTKEDFDRIDSDHDNRISFNEAVTIDKQLRANKK